MAPHSYKHLALSLLFFLLAVLMDVHEYLLSFVLICISLRANAVGHPSMGLFAIWASPSVKRLCVSASLLIGLSASLLLRFERFYIIWTLVFCRTYGVSESRIWTCFPLLPSLP